MAERESLVRISNRMQRWVTPGLLYSQAVFEKRLRTLVGASHRWLDLGCGHRLLPEWRAQAEAELVSTAPLAVGIDADFGALRRHRSFRELCLGDISTLPFRSESFDLVTANMVVEHLDNPAAQFAEVSRVLAPGGLFAFHTPNAASYIVRTARLLPENFKKFLARVLEDRVADDVYPTHYRANKKSEIEQIGMKSGLAVEEVEFVTSSPAFSLVPPLLIFELLWIRQLQRRAALAPYRPALICVLRKSA